VSRNLIHILPFAILRGEFLAVIFIGQDAGRRSIGDKDMPDWLSLLFFVLTSPELSIKQYNPIAASIGQLLKMESDSHTPTSILLTDECFTIVFLPGPSTYPSLLPIKMIDKLE
jgi:hypothetical protein